jgi:hypothetical protein
MHPPEVRAETLALVEAGLNDCEISRRLGIPRGTIRDWRKRRIILEPWQTAIIEAHPWSFIRACVWTDGCAFVNRTDVHRPTPYEYLSYEFSNMSKDIVDLFIASCDRVGVLTRVNRSRRGLWDVRINRRASVALMVEHVGLKA